MTYVVKSRGDRTATIVCVYTCPEHGEFDAEVRRDENGDSPDAIECGAEIGARADAFAPSGKMHHCSLQATWTPSPVFGKVRRVEAVRGKWEKPERPTFMDTRNLGEGQDVDEWRKERRAIWRNHRLDKPLKEFLNK